MKKKKLISLQENTEKIKKQIAKNTNKKSKKSN